MPNILTHNLFAEDVLKEMEMSELSRLIQLYPKEYSIGASGPDFFFYYNVFPWQRASENKRVAAYGGVVHKENITVFYEMAIMLCYKEEDETIKQAMISYLAGHFCHWALDSNSHPYIFYKTNGTTKETAYWHYRFESMIDTLMVIDVKNESLKKYPTSKMMEYDAISVKAITNIYQPILKKLWDIEIDAQLIEKCLHDFQTANRVLFHPNRIFFHFMQGLETIIGKKWIFTSHMILNKVDYKHDILNRKQTTWYNPCDRSLVCKDSFLELYQKAKDIGIQALNAFYRSLEDGNSSELADILQNRSYETGLSVQKEMKYYDSIY